MKGVNRVVNNGLTPQEKKFTEAYIKEQNIRKAMKKAYPDIKKDGDRRGYGSKVIRRPRVMKTIQDALTNQGLTPDYLAKKLKTTIDFHLEDDKPNAQVGLRALEGAIRVQDQLNRAQQSNTHLHLHHEVNIKEKKDLLDARGKYNAFFSNISDAEKVPPTTPQKKEDK